MRRRPREMQYTSGSFAGIAAGWFAWILQPERKMRRPRGHFPARRSAWSAFRKRCWSGSSRRSARVVMQVVHRRAPLATWPIAGLYPLCGGGAGGLGILVLSGGKP